MSATDKFEQICFDRLTASIARRGEQLVRFRAPSPPYAVSLCVYDIEDDPRRPTVTLSFVFPPDPADGPEALQRWQNDEELQWNYAAWGQGRDHEIGFEPDDTALISELLLGVPTKECTKKFVRSLIAVVQRLHRERVTERHLGATIPILIHELVYYEEIARQNVEANGFARVEGFVEWIGRWYKAERRIAYDQTMAAANQSFNASRA